VRGEPRLFLYSRLRCWVALDRGIRLAQRYRLAAPLDRWRVTRDEIRTAILTRGYNEEIGAFTQSFGHPALDASALVIPRLGLLPPTDPRVQSTVERIRAELMDNGLVYRYRTDDGLPGGEATFVLCTYWLVDALALGGRLDQARELFEHVTAYANDVGLLAEEIDPTSGELLGNFPQGFSHMALIGSAVNLAKAATHGAEEQPEDEAERAGRAGPAAAEGRSTGVTFVDRGSAPT
jgi:GH15 family glucan-1,4-alpha-glucosidase